MEAVTHVRVKVCCIASVAEAAKAVSAGADAVGLVSAMPSGPGTIAEPQIATVAASVPPGVGTFLLTCLQDPAEIVAQRRRCRTNTVQLCDAFPVDGYAHLREAMPGVSIVQVIHVVDPSSVAEAQGVAPHVDAILLDSGNPSLAVKQLGGTGRRHDWALSRTIRESVGVPVFLAGGLDAGNVAEAIATVGPFAVDLCSGVRTDDRLDPAKLAAFMDAVVSSGVTPWRP